MRAALWAKWSPDEVAVGADEGVLEQPERATVGQGVRVRVVALRPDRQRRRQRRTRRGRRRSSTTAHSAAAARGASTHDTAKIAPAAMTAPQPRPITPALWQSGRLARAGASPPDDRRAYRVPIGWEQLASGVALPLDDVDRSAADRDRAAVARRRPRRRRRVGRPVCGRRSIPAQSGHVRRRRRQQPRPVRARRGAAGDDRRVARPRRRAVRRAGNGQPRRCDRRWSARHAGSPRHHRGRHRRRDQVDAWRPPSWPPRRTTRSARSASTSTAMRRPPT